jgi:hypothetical protein
LFFLLGVAFYKYLRALDFSKFLSNIGVVILLGSFPILCAFFNPVFTWDDFWQYLFMILAFFFILRDKPLLAAVAFALGTIARESIIFIYPVYVYAIIVSAISGRRNKILAAIIPLLIFILYGLINYYPFHPSRFQNFAKNFIDADRAKSSVFSFLISFGFLWITFYSSIILLGRKLLQNKADSVILLGSVIEVPIHTVFAFTMALAWETRLFFPPFIFIIPLTLRLFQGYKSEIKEFFLRFYGIPGVITVAFSFWVGMGYSSLFFSNFDFRGQPEIVQFYFGIHLGLSLILLIIIMYFIIKVCLCPRDNTFNNQE